MTKENAIIKITEVCGFSIDSIIVFGDDYADIGMLELCGIGVAMGNAIDEVKERADIVIGSMMKMVLRILLRMKYYRYVNGEKIC